ncbi:MAG: hypothetical protein N2491_13615 [Negativicutes bacterium]|nr:hypothetical protein [Negativicutes bacterium]
MQHVPCEKYTVIGALLSQALEYNQKIHRSILTANEKGRITVYFYQDTYILECDTNGDHLPNDYYFFKSAEEQDIYNVLKSMSEFIGSLSAEEIQNLTAQTMQFLKNDFSIA